MRKFTAPSGTVYDVSDAFGSIELHVPGLSDDERHRVIGNIATLNNIDAFLNGKRPEDILGPGATLDQVHGNAWSPDTCGCTVHYVFDHYSSVECDEVVTASSIVELPTPGGGTVKVLREEVELRERGRVHHPHAAPADRHCVHHAHLKGDAVAHHAALLAENQGKNHALAAAAKKLGVPPEEIQWSHDGKRNLVLTHKGAAV